MYHAQQGRLIICVVEEAIKVAATPSSSAAWHGDIIDGGVGESKRYLFIKYRTGRAPEYMDAAQAAYPSGLGNGLKIGVFMPIFSMI